MPSLTRRLRPAPQYVKIPTESEFLVYKSTPQGYVSYRNSEIGTRFIQTLCEVLDLEAKSSSPRDMLTLLTLVNRQGHLLSIAITISINPKSISSFFISPENICPARLVAELDIRTGDRTQMKQMPELQSTLTRLVYLTPRVE